MRIIAITAFVIFCMFLPYLQGDYDASAIPFSAMAQLGGVGALLLFPVGLTWLITEIINQKRTNLQRSILNYRFALVTVFISLIVALFIAFGAFITNHRSLGIFTFVICLYIIWINTQ